MCFQDYEELRSVGGPGIPGEEPGVTVPATPAPEPNRSEQSEIGTDPNSETRTEPKPPLLLRWALSYHTLRMQQPAAGVVASLRFSTHDGIFFGARCALPTVEQPAFNKMAFASTAEIEKQLLSGAEHEEDAESQEEEIRGEVSCSDERSARSQYSYAGGSPESESQSDGGASVGFFEGVFG